MPDPGSVFVFRNTDGRYKAWVCISHRKEAKPSYCYFMALTLDSEVIPSLEELQECSFWGTGHMRHPVLPWSDSWLEQVWRLHPDVKPCHVGAYGLMVSRKDWKVMEAAFQFIGQLSIFPDLELHGNGSMLIRSFDFVQQFFNGTESKVFLDRGQRPFKLAAVVSEANA